MGDVYARKIKHRYQLLHGVCDCTVSQDALVRVEWRGMSMRDLFKTFGLGTLKKFNSRNVHLTQDSFI